MNLRQAFASSLVVAAAVSAPTYAADVPLASSGAWAPFAVDSFLAPPGNLLGWIDDSGEGLNFTFTIAADFIGTLTVVDAGFAGDTFIVTNFGSVFGLTGAVPVGTIESPIDIGLDYGAALANPNFSNGVFTLTAGDYRISGALNQSVTIGGDPLNATAGAINLTVSAVPVPASFALTLTGFGVLGLVARRRRPGR